MKGRMLLCHDSIHHFRLFSRLGFLLPFALLSLSASFTLNVVNHGESFLPTRIMHTSVYLPANQVHNISV